MKIKEIFRKKQISNNYIIKLIIIILFVLLLLFGYGIIPESKLNNSLYQFFYNIKLPLKNIYFLGYKLVFPQYFIYNFLLIVAISVVFFIFYLKIVIGNRYLIKTNKHIKNKVLKGQNFLFDKKLFFYFVLAFLLYFIFLKFFIMKKLFYFQLLLFIILSLILAFAVLKSDKENNINILNVKYLSNNEIKILLSYSLFILVLYAFDLKSWKYSYIEDEWSFFDFVKGNLNDFKKINFFSGSGVYGVHPVLSSVWQSIIMFFTDKSIYGWRLSSAIIVPISIIPFYLWNKMIFNKTTAIIATLVFSFSNAILAFSHIGYNNIQSIFFTLLFYVL